MLTKEQERKLYLLSETLGVEIYVVGVGDRQFLPAQESRPTMTSTRDGALAEWMMACLEAPEEIPWWVHTHPGMAAFFSTTDVEGAHNLWVAIKRPIMATVLGKGGERHDEVLDEDWIAKNPKPKPIGFQAESWGWYDDWERHGIAPDGGWSYDQETKTWRQRKWVPYKGWAYQDYGGRDAEATSAPRTLARSVIDLVEEFGWGSVYDAVRSCAWLADSIDEMPEDLREDAQEAWQKEMDEAMDGARREASGGPIMAKDLFEDAPDAEDTCPHCNTAALRRSDLPGVCDRCGCLIGATAGR